MLKGHRGKRSNVLGTQTNVVYLFIYFALGHSHEEKLANCPYQFEVNTNIFIRVLIKVYLIMFGFRISILHVRTVHLIRLEVTEK